MMQTLKLADDLMQQTRDGEKRVTVRYGRRDIQPGPLTFEATNGTEKDILVEVLRVEVTDYYNVPSWALEGEGQSWDSLFKLLKRFYPDLTPFSEITSIEFKAV